MDVRVADLSRILPRATADSVSRVMDQWRVQHGRLPRFVVIVHVEDLTSTAAPFGMVNVTAMDQRPADHAAMWVIETTR